jgi:hypothetical protein
MKVAIYPQGMPSREAARAEVVSAIL